MTRQINAVNASGLNEFVVDPSSSQGTYTTIQEAVDAADASGGGNVYVKAGTYAETISCKNQVNIAALGAASLTQSVRITGSLVFDTTAGVLNCGMEGLYVEGATAIGVTTSGVNQINLFFNNCTFAAVNNTAFQQNTTGNSFFYDCFFISQAGQKNIDLLNGAMNLFNCNLQVNDTPNTVNGASAIIYVLSSFMSDSFDITAGVVVMFGSFISPGGTLPAVKVRAGGTAAIANSIVTNLASATGFLADGNGAGTSGQFFYFGLGALNPAYTNFDPDLTLGPVFSLPRYLEGVTTAASLNMSVGRSYYCTTGALTLTLPITANVGDVIRVSLQGGTSWSIAQAGSQNIRVGAQLSTAGAGGSVSSSANGDSVTIECTSIGGTDWLATSSMGNLNIV